MGHHKKKRDRDRSSKYEKYDKYDNYDNQPGMDLSSLVNSKDFSNLMNNVDINQLMSQLSNNIGNSSNSLGEEYDGDENMFRSHNNPTVNLINSMRPFIPDDRHDFLDNLAKAFAIAEMIQKSNKDKSSRN